MADGYGYGAEGDMSCAAMVSAAHMLSDGGGNFTEMYMMDFENGRDLLLPRRRGQLGHELRHEQTQTDRPVSR